MSEGKTQITVGGGGFLGMLTVLFIGLKLTHYIDWSWWAVLAPMWVGPAIFLGFATIFLLVGMALAVLGK